MRLAGLYSTFSIASSTSAAFTDTAATGAAFRHGSLFLLAPTGCGHVTM